MASLIYVYFYVYTASSIEISIYIPPKKLQEKQVNFSENGI